MTKHLAPLLALAALATIPTTADAAWYTGSPDLDFKLERNENDLIDGNVLLHSLRVTRCNGQHVNYPINKWVDPVQGFAVKDVIGGNLCSHTWFFSSTMVVAGAGFVVQTDVSSITVSMDPTFQYSQTLPGVYLKSGDFSGSAVRFEADYF